LDSGADIVIIALDELSKEHSLYLANILRNRGYRTEIDYYHTTLKPQFRFAERLNALFIIIIGEEERINKSITIKNTKRKTQETIKEEKLLDYLKEH
ncbi:MAG: His/Gly/Thr/Pro-type tRNA ligase C-terminal domain-containing protein, partial [Bacilli bacterium]|nr:His/Gly/Thr/Pro-type tRNA ligase C-terminal domain-containing protein [Bacilli bacterium]